MNLTFFDFLFPVGKKVRTVFDRRRWERRSLAASRRRFSRKMLFCTKWRNFYTEIIVYSIYSIFILIGLIFSLVLFLNILGLMITHIAITRQFELNFFSFVWGNFETLLPKYPFLRPNGNEKLRTCGNFSLNPFFSFPFLTFSQNTNLSRQSSSCFSYLLWHCGSKRWKMFSNLSSTSWCFSVDL